MTSEHEWADIGCGYDYCSRCGMEWGHRPKEEDIRPPCRATKELHVGANVRVVAWWNGGNLMRGTVKSVIDGYVIMQPTSPSGRAHQRMVELSDVEVVL